MVTNPARNSQGSAIWAAEAGSASGVNDGAGVSPGSAADTPWASQVVNCW